MVMIISRVNDDDEKSIGDSFSSCSVFSKCPADNLSERVVKISSPALLIIMLAMVRQYTECPRKSGVLEISTISYTKSNPIAGVLRYRITPHQKTITNLLYFQIQVTEKYSTAMC